MANVVSESESVGRWSWLTNDYTPWANRYVYWIKSPLGVLVILAAVSLAMGLFVTPQGYVLLLTTLVIVGLGVVWPWIGLRGIGCELTFRTLRCREGDKAETVVEIVNRWPIPVWGLSIENGFFVADQDEEVEDSAVALARIPGWSRSEFVWQFEPRQRGVYPKSAPRIVTAFPFGIWKAKRGVTVRQKLTVWPRTYPLAQFPLPQGQHRCMTSPSDKQTGHEGERIGVRSFRQGDSLRTIHWPLTARHGRFIVSERQGSAQAQARIFVDIQRDAHDNFGPEGTFEWSIRVATSIAAELVQQHCSVIFDFGTHEVSINGSQVSINKALDALARVSPVAESIAASRPSNRWEWSIAIVTDHSKCEKDASGTICLQHRCQSGTSDSAARPWMVLDDRSNLPQSLRSQWIQRSREAWCGV